MIYLDKTYYVIWKQKNEHVNTITTQVKADNAQQAVLRCKKDHSSFGELVDVREK